MTTTIIIAPLHNNYTIRQYLVEVLGYSRRHIILLKRTPCGITVNSQHRTVRHILAEGDTLQLQFANQLSVAVLPSHGNVDILYNDSYLYAVDKPNGIPTHPDRSHYDNTLANHISYHFGQESGYNIHIATRLDKDTSGVVLLSHNSLVASKLSNMLINHTITKQYIAVVQGKLLGSGTIELSLSRQDDTNLTVVDTNGKVAITHYNVLRHIDDCTVVQLYPLTGRTHQLRCHMAHIEHPIVGDTLYGGQQHDRLMLHCNQLQFIHPFTQQSLTITSQQPLSYNNILLDS